MRRDPILVAWRVAAFFILSFQVFFFFRLSLFTVSFCALASNDIKYFFFKKKMRKCKCLLKKLQVQRREPDDFVLEHISHLIRNLYLFAYFSFPLMFGLDL